MNPFTNTQGMSLLMLLAGVGIPVMAALNAGLGSRLDSPVLAALILFAVALVVALAVFLLSGGQDSIPWHSAPRHQYFGGILVAFYVLSITWTAPRIGVGNAVFLVLLGQLVASAVIDHLGLFGAPRSPLGPARSAGIALMALGMLLARRPIDG